ncbi:MAG: DUF1801 domain-containing protein [Clostridiales bacterium]|nr:DUF1801 domain-containing protein [Clostridiales bacterium]
MHQLKTKINDQNVLDFFNKIENNKRKEDSLVILELMTKLTGETKKWRGSSIIGFGLYHYKNKSGHNCEWMKIGFSPRKQSLTLYIMNGYDKYDNLLKKLGKYKLGKSCLYINKLEDIDMDVLETSITDSYDYVSKNIKGKSKISL